MTMAGRAPIAIGSCDDSSVLRICAAVGACECSNAQPPMSARCSPCAEVFFLHARLE